MARTAFIGCLLSLTIIAANTFASGEDSLDGGSDLGRGKGPDNKDLTMSFVETGSILYNIISEQDHQLNAEFMRGQQIINSQGGTLNATYITALGLQMFSSNIEVYSDDEGRVAAAVSGRDVDDLLTPDNDFSVKFVELNGVVITVERFRADYGFTIVARSSFMEIIICADPTRFDANAQEHMRGHLSFEISFNPEKLVALQLSGILASAAISQAERSAASGPAGMSRVQELPEGEDDDYVVSSIFGTDCKFSFFEKRTGERLAKASSRRKMSTRLGASRRFLRVNGRIRYLPPIVFQGMMRESII